MPTIETKTSQSGIVTDANGQRHIPSSQRADGTTRREIKIRPGYKPPEDVELYRNRTGQTLRSRGKGAVPGAEAADDSSTSRFSTAASSKNAKRREARRKTKAPDDLEATDDAFETEEQSKAKPSSQDSQGAREKLSNPSQSSQSILRRRRRRRSSDLERS